MNVNCQIQISGNLFDTASDTEKMKSHFVETY